MIWSRGLCYLVSLRHSYGWIPTLDSTGKLSMGSGMGACKTGGGEGVDANRS